MSGRKSAFRASTEAVPDRDQSDGGGKDQSGDGVDFRSHAAAEAAPDFQRKRVVTANKKEGDGDFIHGESKNEQASGDERKFEVGKGDTEKSLQLSGAEVERGFFLSAIEFLQTGKKFGGGNGDECGRVAKEYGEQAELRSRKDGEH